MDQAAGTVATIIIGMVEVVRDYNIAGIRGYWSVRLAISPPNPRPLSRATLCVAMQAEGKGRKRLWKPLPLFTGGRGWG